MGDVVVIKDDRSLFPSEMINNQHFRCYKNIRGGGEKIRIDRGVDRASSNLDDQINDNNNRFTARDGIRTESIVNIGNRKNP